MKTHPIKSLPIKPVYEILIKNFVQYLKVTGYTSVKQAPSVVREMLWWMDNENVLLEKIDLEKMQKYYYYLRSRPNYSRPGSLSLYTIDGYLFILKLFFKYLQKVSRIASNPMSILEVENYTKTERTVLTQQDIYKLYTACENELERALLSLFYGCGLRKSEAIKLNLRDVDFRSRVLYVRIGKGRKKRIVPLAENVVLDLQNYCYNYRPEQETRHTKPTDKKAFMLNKIGTRMKGDSHWKCFKTILLRSEIKKEVSLHHLRHTIATHLLASGMSIESVRDFLGHEHLESTQIYTRVDLQSVF